MISAEGRKLRAKLAITTRTGTAEEIADAQRRYRAQQLADALRDGLAEADLTGGQLDELVAVIDAARPS
jgi:hypothetical protein